MMHQIHDCGRWHCLGYMESPHQGATRGKAIPETRNEANLGMGLTWEWG